MGILILILINALNNYSFRSFNIISSLDQKFVATGFRLATIETSIFQGTFFNGDRTGREARRKVRREVDIKGLRGSKPVNRRKGTGTRERERERERANESGIGKQEEDRLARKWE